MQETKALISRGQRSLVVFLKFGASVGFLTRYDGELREPLVWPGKSGLHGSGEGSAKYLSSHGRGTGPPEVFKKACRGLSRVAAGNPGFPRLVTLTSGSFSWCLWEIRNTVELGGSSRDSIGVGAMEEGLISS